MANIIHPNMQNFDQLVQNNKVVLVDFWATWCGPCKMLAPVIEQIADEYAGKEGLAIAKVDVDEQQELAQKFGVQSIPTVILFKNGAEADRKVGTQPLSVYTGLLDSML